ncbi:hypothetical protein HDV04_005188 [Boothiomyces sp. JEL0838]|nr:hypothetical protein HDV04_005188 [Boothiomyces sp. JEL0838]
MNFRPRAIRRCSFLTLGSIILLFAVIVFGFEFAETNYVDYHLNKYQYKRLDEYVEMKYGVKQNSSIPNIIWTYWSSSKIPPDIQKFMDSWELSTDYEIRIIKRSDPEFADIFNFKYADNPQRTSDFIRLAALEKYGGIWLDSSIILHSPINWVNAYQAHDQSEFIGYYLNDYTTNRDYPVIENWFLASVPNSQFISDWKNEFYKINEFDTVEEYVKYIQSSCDTQKIFPTDYLTMHIAVQKVLQDKKADYKLTILKAEDTPYIHLERGGFKVGKAVALLKSGQFDEAPIIKLSKYPRLCMGDSWYSRLAYAYEFIIS